MQNYEEKIGIYSNRKSTNQTGASRLLNFYPLRIITHPLLPNP
jgi:hypothetical protein